MVTDALVARLTRGVVGSGTTANHTPFTGDRLAALPEATPEDVATAFERARAAQPAWARPAGAAAAPPCCCASTTCCCAASPRCWT